MAGVLRDMDAVHLRVKEKEEMEGGGGVAASKKGCLQGLHLLS